MKPKSFLTIMFFFMAILCSPTIHAQQLIIWQKDGTKVSYDLDDQPKTTFTSDDLVITTNKTTINYPLSKIQRYTYVGGSLSVSEVKTEGISISHEGDVVIIKGLAKGLSVSVYSIEGKQLLTQQSDGTEQQKLYLSKLPTGVYMIKAKSITYKFLKK